MPGTECVYLGAACLQARRSKCSALSAAAAAMLSGVARVLLLLLLWSPV